MRCAYCYNVPVALGENLGQGRADDDINAATNAKNRSDDGINLDKFERTDIDKDVKSEAKFKPLSEHKSLSEADFTAFLDKRKGKLSGVVFSGGECTLSSSFLPLAREVKARNFALKVDTNGSNLPALKAAIDENLIDYIALDFKVPNEKFKAVTGVNLYSNFIQTLEYLLASGVKFEVRTTIHADLLNENDISKMAQILYEKGYKEVYYLQNFLDTGENFGNLGAAKAKFDPNLINSKLKIGLRNF